MTMTAIYSDPSLDGPNLDIRDQTISAVTGYSNDLGTITGGPGSQWGLAQWSQRSVITPADLVGGNADLVGGNADLVAGNAGAADPRYGAPVTAYREPDGAEGLAIYRDPATGRFVYDLRETSGAGGIAGERDLFLQAGSPTVADVSFASPLSADFDLRVVRADAAYDVAGRNDPGSAAAQVFWGATALFAGPGDRPIQLFIQGGITDSRFGSAPVPYSRSTGQGSGAIQALVNATKAGSAPIDYFADTQAPRHMSYSLTGALEQAIASLGLDVGTPDVDNPANWRLDGFYVGIASDVGVIGPARLDTEIQLSSIVIGSDTGKLVSAADVRAGADIPMAAPRAPPSSGGFTYIDASSGLSGRVAGNTLAANSYGLERAYTCVGADDVAITAASGNVFLQGGSGNDVLTAMGGSNVLVAGTAASWLAGAAGHDTFEADLAPGSARWVGIGGFHAGEWAVINDFVPGHDVVAWSDVSAYAGTGRPMMELRIGDDRGGGTSLDFDGMSPADLGGVDVSTRSYGGQTVLQVTHY